MDGDETSERYKLFDNALWEYFWDYDNARALRDSEIATIPLSLSYTLGDVLCA